MTQRTKGTARSERRRVPGMAVAGFTAVISGVSIFTNSYGVHAVSSPTVYTTAKNLVATAALVLFALVGRRSSQRRSLLAKYTAPASTTRWDRGSPSTAGPGRTVSWGRWMAFGYIGVVGGGLAFVLFFNGLAQSAPASAAFWRDTLVLWVALLAVPVLGERVRWWNVAAIALLIGGEVTFTGGVGSLGSHQGELLVLASTVLWAIEVVIAKRLLVDVAPSTLAVARMGVGAVTLMIYLTFTGSFAALSALDALQWRWALLTGILLALYVATWMTALSRAKALDVTSVLVASVVVTWLLQVLVGTATPAIGSAGLVLIAIGVGLVGWSGVSRRFESRRVVEAR